jgi:RimJ/RimL family protein N-acetyltransferase
MSENGVISNWQPKLLEYMNSIEGKFTLLEKLSLELHTNCGLFESMTCADAAERFRYLLGQEVPRDVNDYIKDILSKIENPDRQYYAIRSKETGIVGGFLSLMRITPEHGVCEIGSIYFGPTISRTQMATESVFLLLKHAFESGYRRVEWKCNNRNELSKSAALRYGFQFEGVFRKHMIIRGGENRDTAWFAMLDDDWSGGLRSSFVEWLDESNFTATGKQIHTLVSLRAVS